MLILFVKKDVMEKNTYWTECSPKMLWYTLASYEWVKMSGMERRTAAAAAAKNNMITISPYELEKGEQ